MLCLRRIKKLIFFDGRFFITFIILHINVIFKGFRDFRFMNEICGQFIVEHYNVLIMIL